MQVDIVDLHEFYHSAPGRAARRLLRARVAEAWPTVAGERVLALGYGLPLLRPWLGQAAAIYAFMPAAQGVLPWPREGPNLACLVEAGALPLPDACIDRVVVMHALEGVADPAPLLREVWRVMKAGARILVIAPNRHGLWAHNDRTPFGHGQPYSLAQITTILHQQGFWVEQARHALYVPPGASRLGLSLTDRIEKAAARLVPSFGGVVMAEAGKQLYAPRVEKKSASHRLLAPLPLTATEPVAAGRVVGTLLS